MKRQSMVRQTALLTGANAVVRALGFAMRVWLSRAMGAEAIGVLELASSAHMLWIAPVTSGVPMAVAREAASGRGEEALRAGRRLALRISLIMLPALAVLLPVIALALGDARTLPALAAYLPCLPVLALSAAYNGYCYGAGNTLPPALSEMVEQGLRFCVCLSALTLLPRLTAAYTAAIPPVATLVGEGVSVAMVVWMLRRGGVALRGDAPKALQKKILAVAAPMTWMRLSGTLMRTVNSVLIPLRLRAGGLSAQEATARLGMLSGMALPLVMLPGVVTGALAMVTGPALARHQREPWLLRKIVVKALSGAVAVSAVCGAALYIGAPWLARTLYRQPDLAAVLRAVAPLTPLMGVSQVLGGMLTGLGRQRRALASSLAGSLITLVLSYLLAPAMRLNGCAAALIAGSAVSAALHLHDLIRTVRREPGTMTGDGQGQMHPTA